MVNVKDLFSILPDLINILFPGIITISLFLWIESKQLDLSSKIVWSIIIGFIIKSIFSAVHLFIATGISFHDPIKILSYIIFGILIVLLFEKLKETTYFQKVLYSLNYKTSHNTIFDDVIDYEKGNIIVVRMKNTDNYYIGNLCVHEEKGIDSWISLIHYKVYNKNDEVIADADKTKNNYILMINERDILSIDVLYEDNSLVWKRLNGK